MRGIAGGFIQAQESFAKQDLMAEQTRTQQVEQLHRTAQMQQYMQNTEKLKQEMQMNAAKQAAALQLQQAMQRVELTGDFAADQIRLAQTALQSGDSDAAAKYLDKGSQAALRATQETAQLELAGERQAQAALHASKRMAEQASTIVDQGTMEAWSKEYEATFKRPSPFRDRAYSPELVQQFQDSVNEGLGRQSATMREREAKRREARDRVMEQYRLGQLQIRREEIAARERQHKKTSERQGTDKPIPNPTQAVRTEAEGYIKRNWPDIRMRKEDLNLASTELYYKAMERMKANPAIRREDAFGQAIWDMHKNNYFGVIEESQGLFKGSEKRLTYHAQGSRKGIGSSADKPREFDGTPEAQREKGWYRVPTKSGERVVYWTGKGWSLQGGAE